MTAAEKVREIANEIAAQADRLEAVSAEIEPYLVESARFARRELQVAARRVANLAKVIGTAAHRPS